MSDETVAILNTFVGSLLEDVHTALPGRIESYEGHSERKARVKPLVMVRPRVGGAIEIPPIDNVPVVFPSSGAAELIFPLQRGDGCLLIFSEAALGSFLEGTGATEPETSHRHALTDAICIPGLWSFRSVPAPPPAEDSLYLRYNGAAIEITAGGDINLADANGNTMEMTAGKVVINGGNLEVLQ